MLRMRLLVCMGRLVALQVTTAVNRVRRRWFRYLQRVVRVAVLLAGPATVTVRVAPLVVVMRGSRPE